MSRKRLLPEAAYDFWVRDGRDGEERSRRHSLADALSDQRAWRATIRKWQRCCITVEWAVNERKVLRLLQQASEEPKERET